jgi:hypothetical protein
VDKVQGVESNNKLLLKRKYLTRENLYCVNYQSFCFSDVLNEFLVEKNYNTLTLTV